MEPETAKIDAFTNTNPLSQVALINKETKKKPYDVKIKNYNPNEPKIQVNMKYSDKQRFRRYKTKTEPKLFSKITIDEEDDIVKTIKKAFGIEDKNKLNYSEVETSGTPYYETPIPQQAPEIVNQEQPQIRERPQMIEGPIRQQPQMRERPIRQPSASTEITSEIAQPPQMSPGKLTTLMLLKQSEENIRIQESALAINKAEQRQKDEKERERLMELSRIAKEESEKTREQADKEREEQDAKSRKKIAEINERERKRFEEINKKEEELVAKKRSELTKEERKTVDNIILRRKAYQEELKKYIGLTPKEKEILDYEFFKFGYPPRIDTFGRTPEERAEKLFWIEKMNE